MDSTIFFKADSLFPVEKNSVQSNLIFLFNRINLNPDLNRIIFNPIKLLTPSHPSPTQTLGNWPIKLNKIKYHEIASF